MLSKRVPPWPKQGKSTWSVLRLFLLLPLVFHRPMSIATANFMQVGTWNHPVCFRMGAGSEKVGVMSVIVSVYLHTITPFQSQSMNVRLSWGQRMLLYVNHSFTKRRIEVDLICRWCIHTSGWCKRPRYIEATKQFRWRKKMMGEWGHYQAWTARTVLNSETFGSVIQHIFTWWAEIQI